MLEAQKTKAINDILKLNRVLDEFQLSLPQKGGATTKEHSCNSNNGNTNGLPTQYEKSIHTFFIFKLQRQNSCRLVHLKFVYDMITPLIHFQE